MESADLADLLQLSAKVAELADKIQKFFLNPLTFDPVKAGQLIEPVMECFARLAEAEKNQAFNHLLGLSWAAFQDAHSRKNVEPSAWTPVV